MNENLLLHGTELEEINTDTNQVHQSGMLKMRKKEMFAQLVTCQTSASLLFYTNNSCAQLVEEIQLNEGMKAAGSGEKSFVLRDGNKVRKLDTPSEDAQKAWVEEIVILLGVLNELHERHIENLQLEMACWAPVIFSRPIRSPSWSSF